MQAQKDSIWYERSSKGLIYCPDKYLQQQGFTKGSAQDNLYTKIDNDKLQIIVVYVYDIICGSNEESMSQNFASVM